MAKTRHRKTFDRLLRVGVPSALAEATASAAIERLESLNDYVRRALLARNYGRTDSRCRQGTGGRRHENGTSSPLQPAFAR